VPPGQIKRYTRGAKLPAEVDWEDNGDLSNWKLPPPGKGNKYIKVENEILKIAEDTQTVIDAVGIVGDLLK
jgi:Ni/Co efflux regulator RcnB